MQTWIEDIIEQICIAQILKDSTAISGKRLSLIIVDNAVEYMLKAYGDTYLVPKGKIKRDEWEKKKVSFRQLLDCVVANSNFTENPDDIFNYHDKLRNPLYHEAAPLSVEPRKIEDYIQKAKTILKDLFAIELSEEEWKNHIQKTIIALGGKIAPKLVEFFLTEDGLVRMQTQITLKDTEAILLMIYGFMMITGRAPTNIEELEKCLNYSGHPIDNKKLVVKVSQLRGAKKINREELTLTAKARDQIKKKYFIPSSQSPS
ncbi:MAG: hypothetical protein QXR45_12290 [Candidatus Bathyarchaeia archaeon]